MFGRNDNIKPEGAYLPERTPMPVATDSTRATMPVVLTGLSIPFWDLVVILVKLAIAAIPAVIILSMISGAIFLFGIAVFSAHR